MLLEQWLLKPGIEGSASPFDLTSSSLSPKSSVSSPPPPTLVQHSNNALISEWLMKPISYPPLFPPEPGSLDIQPVFTRLDPTIAFGLQTRLNKYMAAMERPLISREEPMWDMEDPDLMPTLNDWILCHRMMTDDGKTNPISGEYDAEAFLFEFYQLPPVLRLTRCAIAATYHLTQTEAFEYYRRARKAFSKAGSEPSLELIRAYIAVNGFAMNMLGQPLVGLQFLKLAVTMIRDIKLYIDPDDSPWLDYLNLTERQKEDRRRAFWQVYFYYVWHQTICNDSDYIDIELSCDKIKAQTHLSQCFEQSQHEKITVQLLDLLQKLSA
ncbi:hypothetical protein BCR33DRAFT_418788 [Rhizoclosmatium globosum]|uniref:Xylanolytic transcriptional activator regulatory domain-containing protein n=1 Tax=Rhizoclosmatium globosum TaxID=329046 RepID=A0A1Y2BWW8_9FUNG|nr:hypothetical protein BCR33DRAFT_418788 [Rhizoclosmatium globosum]|eukprot:ORY39147.1 hypothetical protein BCR33DRAFT_418788 [Rhizoclosmatium globosum]